eukprot:UN13629
MMRSMIARGAICCRSSIKSTYNLQHTLISSNSYNGWIETITSPFSSAISPLQRISQMYSDGNDRYRFSKDIDINLNIIAIEIWQKSSGQPINTTLRGIANNWIVLKLQNSNSCFLLNRVVSGIQLSRLPLKEDGKSISECNLFKSDEM